jgi:uncharacterized membrane protein YkvA (DUF1232 family)
MPTYPEEPPSAAQRAGRLVGRTVLKARQAMGSPKARQAGRRAAEAASSQLLGRMRGRAGLILGNRERLLSLAGRGEHLAGSTTAGTLGQLGDEMKVLLRLVRAYATGEYRQVPLESMLLIVAGVGYVVSPLDLIPDFVPGAGALDDLTVLSFVLGIVRRHLDEFLAWERRDAIDIEVVERPALEAGPPSGDC